MPPRLFAAMIRSRTNRSVRSALVADPDSAPLSQPTQRFDGLSRNLVASPSRRAALRLVASAALAAIAGLQSSDDVDARSLKKKCRKLTRRSARRRCLRRARAKHRTGKKTPAARSQDASCLAAWDDAAQLDQTFLLAQTFTAPNSGNLTQVRLLFSRQDVPDSSYFELDLNTVDPHSGRPTHNIIAKAFVPANEVGNRAQWPTMVEFGYGPPTPLIAGRQYALVLFQSAQDDDASHFVYFAAQGQCTGGGVYTAGMTTPFTLLGPGMSMIYETIFDIP